MSFKSVFTLILLGVSLVVAQRSPYAGSRPSSGYKDKFTNVNAASSATPTVSGGVQANGNTNSVIDRFGETGTAASTTVGPSTTTTRLPYDALGDSFAVQQAILKPQDHQPFWLINQGHIEAHRGGNGGRPQVVAPSGTTNGQGVINRFGENDGSVVAGGVGPTGFDPTNINQISQPEIVFPVNMNVPNRASSQSGTTQTVAQNLVPAQQPASPPQPADQQSQLQQLQLELQQERQKQQLLQQLLLQQQGLNSQQSIGQQPIPQQPIPLQPIRQEPIPQQPIRQEPIRQETVRQEPIGQQFVQSANTPNFNDEQFASSDNFYHIKSYFPEFDY